MMIVDLTFCSLHHVVVCSMISLFNSRIFNVNCELVNNTAFALCGVWDRPIAILALECSKLVSEWNYFEHFCIL